MDRRNSKDRELRERAMAVIPGTHTMDQVPHRDTFDRHNLLTRGQEVAVEVDEAQQVPLVLRPGEMSLHHVRLVHGSAPNPSGDRRIGFAIRYIPTRLRQLEGEDSATLVRGTDRYVISRWSRVRRSTWTPSFSPCTRPSPSAR